MDFFSKVLILYNEWDHRNFRIFFVYKNNNLLQIISNMKASGFAKESLTLLSINV